MKKNHISISIMTLGLLGPYLVFAGSPGSDVGNAATHGSNLGVASNTSAQQVLKTVKDYGLDSVAYMLAQKLGQKMASLAINKTNGGASSDKDPNFVKEFGSIFTQIEEQQRDLYTTKLLTSNNPYARAIAQDMIQSSFGNQLSKFTLGNFMSNGADISTATQDLKVLGGNGLAFFGELANPQNTPFGSSLIAQNQLAQQISDKSRTEAIKMTGGGFLPDSKCTTSISDYKTGVGKIIGNKNAIDTASGSIDATKSELSGLRDSQTQAIATYGDNSKEANAADEAYYAAEKSGNESIKSQQQAISSAAFGSSTTAQGLAMDTAGCIEELVKNPVSAVQTITADAGKFGMDMTKNIQGWGQIVAGLFVSLFNGFINTGLSSLKSDYGQTKTKKTATGGPEQLSQKILGGGVEANTNFASAPTVIIDLRNDFESSMNATEKNISVLKEVTNQLFLVPQRLTILDICLPGPDIIGLNTRLDKYYDQQTAWIQKSSIMGSDAKRNIDQALVISMLERDYSIARAEMNQDILDDSKNIPGANAMRTMINTFSKKKVTLQTVTDSSASANAALSQLRRINTDLKDSISFLKSLEPAALGSLPGTIFTTAEWNATPSADREAIYNWMKTNSPTPPIELAGLSAAELETAHRKYVIKNTWDLWEYPFKFFKSTPVLDENGKPQLDASGKTILDKKWSDEKADGTSIHSDQFLDKKNQVRSIYDSIKDIIPAEWEISKNQQLLTSIKTDIKDTDSLIHDCDKMRQLIWGDDGATESGWFVKNPVPAGEDARGRMLADLIKNKDVYFKSEQVKNALTLPSIFTRNASFAEDGCRPDSAVNYQATYPVGKAFAEHVPWGNPSVSYTCLGNFGHIFGVESESSTVDFNKWIDESANAYQGSTHINWPTELYYRSRIIKFIPPPAEDPYGKGWTKEILRTNAKVMDDGESRPLFCRFNAFQQAYGGRSGADIEHFKRGIICSSKWTDVTSSEALGLFLISSLN